MLTIQEVIKRNFNNPPQEYIDFAIQKDQCRKCSLYNHYQQVIQSEGCANNPIFMFIGEAAGREEIEQIRPFIGPAGQRLREELRKYPDIFNKNTTMISNLLSCRPPNNKFPRDGGDGPWELNVGSQNSVSTNSAHAVVYLCYEQWCRKEIAILKPKVVVTLGAVPLNYIREWDVGISKKRGTWEYDGSLNTWIFSTYHPSYVIRCTNDKNKLDVPEQFKLDIKHVAMNWKERIND